MEDSVPGCVLRAASIDFHVDDFLAATSLHPCDVYRKDEPKGQTGKLYDKSGITIVVSEASGDEFAQQVQDASAFLEHNRDEINRLQSYVGNEEMVLDFGIWSKEVFVQSHYLPPELLRLAGESGVGIELSIYLRQEKPAS
jgi:hypothetical protein